MTTLSKGRIVPESALGAAPQRVTLPGARAPHGRVVASRVLEAEARARAILAEAERRAADLVESARRESADVRLRAVAEGRAEGVAAVAARALALLAREHSFDAQNLDRSVALARVLAERLLGEALTTEPGKVAALARAALSEARGARRVLIAAHPDDVTELAARLGELGFDSSLISLRPDAARQRGALRIETDIGVLDAELSPQLDRLIDKLTSKLRESIER